MLFTLIYTDIETGCEVNRAVLDHEPEMDHITECALIGIAITIVS